MIPVQLAFKAFDCHELLCHAMAQASGLYAGKGLSVKLVDSTFVPDEALPERSFHVACGAALASFMAGNDRKVVFVACDRPMFWLYGRPGINTLTDLAGACVASFPDAAPPARFLHKLLSDAGVVSDIQPCRDDVARLGLLRSGSVDAALLSSLVLPHELESHDLQTLAFVGDNLRLPSTGLATSGDLLEKAPELVAVMVGVFQQAMRAIFDDDLLLSKVLVNTFAMPEQGLEHALQTVRACYNPSGVSDESRLQSAVDAMAQAMGLKSRPARELYEFR
jgi:ABC-type nitrate/sulfonate/bicarbonate transport system substrate-binding protein